MAFYLIYNDEQLREQLTKHQRGAVVDPAVATVVMDTLPFVLRERDDARARCVELLGERAPRRSDSHDATLKTARTAIQRAIDEGPVDEALTDAVLALVEYLEQGGP